MKTTDYTKSVCVHIWTRLSADIYVCRLASELQWLICAILAQNEIRWFWDTFILYVTISIIKVSSFRDDTTDVSARTGTRVQSGRHQVALPDINDVAQQLVTLTASVQNVSAMANS